MIQMQKYNNTAMNTRKKHKWMAHKWINKGVSNTNTHIHMHTETYSIWQL